MIVVVDHITANEKIRGTAHLLECSEILPTRLRVCIGEQHK